MLDESVFEVGPYLREVPHCLRVGDQAVREVVDDRVEAERLDEEPGAGSRLENAQDLERLHGLSDGIATDAKLTGEIAFRGERIAWLQVVADDVSLDLLLNLMEEGRPLERPQALRRSGFYGLRRGRLIGDVFLAAGYGHRDGRENITSRKPSPILQGFLGDGVPVSRHYSHQTSRIAHMFIVDDAVEDAWG